VASDHWTWWFVGSGESWVHLELELGDEPITLAFDVVDGGADHLPGPIDSDGTADYAIVVDPGADEAQAWVRAELDPVQYDGMPPPDPRPPPVDGWMPQQLSLNRARVIPARDRRARRVLRRGRAAERRDGARRGRLRQPQHLASRRLDADDAHPWEPWQSTNHTERVKEGVQAYVDAQYDVTPR
jgi:hypothetical protein